MGWTVPIRWVEDYFGPNHGWHVAGPAVPIVFTDDESDSDCSAGYRCSMHCMDCGGWCLAPGHAKAVRCKACADKMRVVELRLAYHWICDDCGADNFVLPRDARLTEDERENAYRRFNDLEPWEELPEDWQQFVLCQIPKQVHCSCGSTFRATDETTA